MPPRDTVSLHIFFALHFSEMVVFQNIFVIPWITTNQLTNIKHGVFNEPRDLRHQQFQCFAQSIDFSDLTYIYIPVTSWKPFHIFSLYLKLATADVSHRNHNQIMF